MKQVSTYIICGLMFNEFISFLSAMMLKMFIQDYGHGVSDETDEIDLWASLTISASILAIVPMAVFIRFDSDLTMVRHQSRVALSVVLLTSGTFFSANVFYTFFIRIYIIFFL